MSRPAVSDGLCCLFPGSHLALFFRSSALRSARLSPGLNTTTASADFPRPLGLGISLGQYRPFPSAPSGSTCAVNDSRASLVLACSPPDAPPHCQFVFLRSEVCLRPFRVSPLRFPPGRSATVVVITPSGTFHPERFGTCQAHDRRHPCRCHCILRQNAPARMPAGDPPGYTCAAAEAVVESRADKRPEL